MQLDVLKLKAQKWYSSGHPVKNEKSKTGVNFVQNVPLKENWETRNFKQKEAALQKQLQNELLTWKKGSKRAIVTFMKKIKKKKKC